VVCSFSYVFGVFSVPHFYFTEHCVHLQLFMDPADAAGRYVPRCVKNGSKSLGLKALEDFVVEKVNKVMLSL
jgi:hypothetical protein